MKRVLTKTAAIIDTVLYGLISAFCSLLFGLILSGSALLYEYGALSLGVVFTAVLVLIIFIISVVGLTFSVKAISFSRADKEAYRNKFPLLISNCVFNFMFAGLVICFSLNSSNILDTIFLDGFVLCSILYIIDMVKNTKGQENFSTEYLDDTDVDRKENTVPFNLEFQLKKLNDLKDQNLITETELTQLREKLIKQEIDKK